jgi:hypothetical protein
MAQLQVTRTAGKVERQPLLQMGARVGYAVSGVLHLLIGWLAFQVAWAATTAPADQSGALQALTRNELGRLTLWVSVAGFLALGLWQLANTLASHRQRGSSPWSIRAKGIAKTVLYLALAWASFSTANGHPGSSAAQSADFTATLLQHNGGRLVVAGVGLAVIAAGIYHVFKGWTRKFLRDLSRHPGALATRAGVIGYIAKGVALCVVGVLFFLGAAQNSALKATGLDGALRTLREQPKGPWVLTAVALGIAAYGVYSFARAKHARV